jgi:hypothetical protein
VTHLVLGATPDSDDQVAMLSAQLLRDLGVPALNADVHVASSNDRCALAQPVGYPRPR